MATRMQQRRGTEAQWTSADPILAAGEIGFESDTGQFKIGDGVNHWSDLSYFKNLEDLGGNLDDYLLVTTRGAANGVASLDAQGQVPASQLSNVLASAPQALDTLNELAAALGNDANFSTTILAAIGTKVSSSTFTSHTNATTSVHGIADTSLLATKQYADDKASEARTAAQDTAAADAVTKIATHNSATTSVHGIANTALLATKSYADGAVSTAVAALTKSSVGLGNVDNTSDANKPVSTATQTALDAKASLAGATFTGTVNGITKSMVGLGSVDNTADADKPVSTATQTALDLKAPKADATFTGTVTLPSTTSIGNVSATELGYVDGVTSAIQTQIDAKLSKSGGTMTGALTLSGDPTSALHAVTKQYADGLAAGINFHQAVVAATTGNLAGVYDNGTNGLGATITASANGSIGTIDGASVSVGSRILLKSQTDATQNGIYTVTNVGSGSTKWVVTRATDADNNPAGELATGDFCFVTGGSTNIAKGFILSTTGTIIIGTTNVNYTQFNASEAVTAGTGITKSGSTISISTGAITSDMIADGAIVDADINASAAIAQSKISGLTSDLAAKAPLANPTFTGTVTVGASGVAFTDGTQTKEGVASRTPIIQKTAGYTLSALTERDSLIEVSSASGVTISIPTDATLNYPVGTSIDILQTNTGQVTIAAVTPGTTTVNGTPGLKLRSQWSSATLFKRAANTWVVMGDLTA